MATKLVKPYSDFGSLEAALYVFDKKNFNHKVCYRIHHFDINYLYIFYFLFFGHSIVF